MSALFTPAQESAISEATKAYCRRVRSLRCRVNAIELLDAAINFDNHPELWLAAAREVIHRSSSKLGIPLKRQKTSRRQVEYRER